jgi:hypothetical protein
MHVCFFLYKVKPASPISLWQTDLQSQRTFICYPPIYFHFSLINFEVIFGLFKKRTLVWIAAFIVLCVSLPLVHRLLVFSRQRHRFIASSDVKFPFFITPSISVSHFASGRSCLCLPSGDHFFIRLGHLLSSMRTTCPDHFNMFSWLSKNFCVTPFFSVNPYSLLLVVWWTWRLFSKNLLLYLTVFVLTCNPVF